MDGHSRLKTLAEQRRDVERELDYLDQQAQAALIEYQRRLAEIDRQRKRELKRLRAIMQKEGLQKL